MPSLGRRIEKGIRKIFKKGPERLPPRPPSPPRPPPPPPPPPSPPPSQPPPPPPPPPPSPPPPPPRKTPFLFPQAESTIVPDPSKFFIPSLLSAPLPTNSFFQNFVLNNVEPEYIHPYLIKSSPSSLSVSYPSRSSSSTSISQLFTADLTISASSDKTDHHSRKTHVVSSFSDLGVTLEFPSSNMQFYLVRGSPYLTVNVKNQTPISISTVHSILSLSSNNGSLNSYTLELSNGQTWLIYTSSPISLNQSPSEITSQDFMGIIRIALLPDSNPKLVSILNQFIKSL